MFEGLLYILFSTHVYIYIIQSGIIVKMIDYSYILSFIVSKTPFIRRCAFGFVDFEAKEDAKRLYLLDRC